LLQALSYGLITDDEYHIEMYARPRPDSVPELSGTRFFTGTEEQTNANDVSPNADPLGRSVSSTGAKSARSKNGGTGK